MPETLLTPNQKIELGNRCFDMISLQVDSQYVFVEKNRSNLEGIKNVLQIKE